MLAQEIKDKFSFSERFLTKREEVEEAVIQAGKDLQLDVEALVEIIAVAQQLISPPWIRNDRLAELMAGNGEAITITEHARIAKLFGDSKDRFNALSELAKRRFVNEETIGEIRQVIQQGLQLMRTRPPSNADGQHAASAAWTCLDELEIYSKHLIAHAKTLLLSSFEESARLGALGKPFSA